MVVVSFLTVVLASILSSVWRGLCLPTMEAAARCRLSLEASLATAALARDLGGAIPEPSGELGSTTDGRLVGRDTPASDHLRLCFHGGTSTDLTPQWAAPDIVVSYQLVGDQLIRTNGSTGVAIVVARELSSFQVAPLADGSGVSIQMTFALRGLSLTYQLAALDPPS
jgi:hypothetical protein